MKPFSSLYAKILFWLFFNLLVITGVLVVFFAFQSQIDLNTLLGRQAVDRMWVAGRLISYELNRTARENWSDVLTRHSKLNQVSFSLVLRDGTRFLSKDLDIPEAVMIRVVDAFKPPPPEGESISDAAQKDQDGQQAGTHDRDLSGQHSGEEKQVSQSIRDEGKPRLMMRTQSPTRYWARTLIPLSHGTQHMGPPAMLLAVSDSITGNGFFFDPLPWVIAAAMVLFISVLFWIPLVRNITRPIVRMTRAAEEITRGKFEVRINEARADEIGRLGSAINHMTSRLSAYMKGQKRFLGDVAHELGSPIARIQVGLGILEQRSGADNQQRVADVMEDVAHMSNLVNELLSFSRAEVNPSEVKLVATDLAPIIKRAVQREATPSSEVIVKTEPHARVVADPELLTRAVSNLIRNAVRYAAEAGPVLIKSKTKGTQVVIEVMDSGPGVPASLVDQLFEPFYRLEPSRDRESGGVGLGLAIVKTCIETCKGVVSARNLEPSGFAVTIVLPSGK